MGKGQNLGPFPETVNGFCGFEMNSSFVFWASPMPESEISASELDFASPRQSGMRIRFAVLAIALIPATLLVVASQLEPSASGLGTHHQLGLPPCSFRVLFGIRCPGCGMTTSWAYFVRGEWLASMSVNLGGFLLALCGVASTGVFGRSAWSGRMPGIETQKWMTIAVVAVTLVTILDWSRRMAGL